MEVSRYHLESTFLKSDDEREIFVSVMFKEFFSFCLQSYERELPSKKFFQDVNREYFSNYYDFAYMILTELLTSLNNLDEISEKNEIFLIFSKLPLIESINFDGYLIQVFEK